MVSARIPASTYRLQLNGSFSLEQAAELIDYLCDLGISDCYVSPVTVARWGSLHGYDVIDHSRLNPELGGEEQFLRFARLLRDKGMGLMLDTVPNHMCVADPANRWWFDILENGPSSPYAQFFDIDWDPPKADLANKVLLPVLGDQYGRVLENQEIKISYHAGAFEAHYYDLRLPLAPRTWTSILVPTRERLAPRLGDSHPEVMMLESIITAITHLPLRTETDPDHVRERQREKEIIKSRLSALVESSLAVSSALEQSLVELNGTRGDARSFDRLEALLGEQAYRLSFWHVAADEINYRRFFDVNDLAAIRVEEPEVFAAVHELVFCLIEHGAVTGLRIDHVDGLLDPKEYLHLLQRECASRTVDKANDGGSHEAPESEPPTSHAFSHPLPFYVVVEKILTGTEQLREDWPVHGTTGYDFLNALNGLFVESTNRRAFLQLYQRFTGLPPEFPEIIYESKRLVLRASMSGEQNVLARALDRISESHRWSRDFTLNSLGRVLAEVIAYFPVYRSYVTSDGTVAEDDRRYILLAINGAKRRNPALSESIFDFLASVLLLEHPEGLDAAARHERLDFTLRFQQVTSPVMAKGFEDTALYRFYPLASSNEVGGDPLSFGLSAENFHRLNVKRLHDWPHSLSATATHDTKRGEDVRARINVLSEIPEQWRQALRRWHKINARLRTEVEGLGVPDRNEEYLFYQTLIGCWPLETMPADQHDQFVKRVGAYMDKAAKEAKLHTSWVSPNHEHDCALARFVETTLRREPANAFLCDFISFLEPVAAAGMLNSLSQTLLKIASPGVPDFYQGTELWDLSLVDPDNRRAVDYGSRKQLLAKLQSEAAADPAALSDRLLRRLTDGALKMYVISCALRFRREHQSLFASGSYDALEVAGERSRHLVAFARSYGEEQVIVAAGRFFAGLGGAPAQSAVGSTWAKSILFASRERLHERYVDLFTGKTIAPNPGADKAQLAMADIFAHLPVAMLVAQQ
jgi:(1->4)-alpha-D-glucan 1-alpha-D-glucosylmutase